MNKISTNGRRIFIARHGETIFNYHGRIQGEHPFTPLTKTGFLQADEMGEGLASYLMDRGEAGTHRLYPIASDTDRALQTLSLVCEHIGVDWHGAATDPRLREIDLGKWGGQYYRDLTQEITGLLDEETKLFTKTGQGGENYTDVSSRLQDWIDEQSFDQDMLMISHGMTTRVLRGMLCGGDVLPDFGVPVGHSLPQGSMVMIQDGIEEIIHLGGGGERA